MSGVGNMNPFPLGDPLGEANPRFALWVHMHDEHKLPLLDSELGEIIRLAVVADAPVITPWPGRSTTEELEDKLGIPAATPRTDAETASKVRIAGFVMTVHGTIVSAAHAKKLERELATATLNNASLQRRLKWAQQSAEKHHEGDRAACEREQKLIAQLNERPISTLDADEAERMVGVFNGREDDIPMRHWIVRMFCRHDWVGARHGWSATCKKCGHIDITDR